jgi:hypothetical protein
MSDSSQIVVPPSFVALFVPPGRIKPTAPHAHILARYELCEDLATMLTETARTMLWQLSITEADVLERMRRGLAGDEAVVDAAEAAWVLRRLAELLDWTPLPDDLA